MMERLPRGNERNNTTFFVVVVSEDKEDDEEKRKTPGLFVEIIFILEVLLRVEEAKEIAEETLLLMRKDISRHAIIVSLKGKK